jgi:hypothetical protein
MFWGYVGFTVWNAINPDRVVSIREIMGCNPDGVENDFGTDGPG